MSIGRRLALGGLGIVVVVFGGSWAIDFAHAGAVHMSVHISPSVIPADGQTAGRVTLRVVNPDGTPRAGDLLDVLDESQNPGTVSPYRLITDRHGVATFTYTPQAVNAFITAAPARVLVTDSSFGHLVEVDKMTTLTIPVVDPSKLKKGTHGTRTSP